MDDANRKADSNQTVVSNQQPTQDQNAPAAATAGSVGSVQKELAPIGSKVKSEISKIIEASERAPAIPTEGVEQVSDKLILTDEHKVEHAGESISVPNQPQGAVGLLKRDEVKAGLQVSPVYSGRWLAEVRRRVLKMFGLWKKKE